MNQKPIYLFLLFIFSACVDSDQQNIPEWVLNPPQIEGKVFAVGVSENGRLLSLTDALDDLSHSIGSEVSRSEQTFNEEATSIKEEIVDENFGDIQILSKYNSYTTRSTKNDSILKSNSENILSLLFSKENRSMSIKTFTVETNNSQNKGHFEVTHENSDYSDIIKELETAGVVIKSTFQNNTHYYTLLELTESLYENQMKPKEITEEEIKALYEELEKSIKKIK